MRRQPRPSPEKMQKECDDFNAKHPAGTPIEVWTGYREGAGKITKVGSGGAYVLGGHTTVVHAPPHSCVALTHVKVLPEGSES